MKKSLLALLTAGTMGCSNYKTPFLPTSVTLDSNEKGGYIFGEVNKETRNGEYCSREVLLGMEGGNLQSVVMTEHCKKLSGDNGKALAKRYKDTDNDGYVDEMCQEDIEVFYGFSHVTSQTCDPMNHESMTYLLNEALEWALKVRDQ